MPRNLLRHLPFFLAAAEEQNFQRAAIRLNMSQPALSRRMQDLERALGVALFDRRQGRVRLTKQGERLLVRGRRIMDELKELKAEIAEDDRKVAEVLRVGVNENALRQRAIIEAFHRVRVADETMQLRIRGMSSQDQLGGLRADQLDVGFLYLDTMNLSQSEFASYEIPDWDRYVLVTRSDHRLAKRSEIFLGDLRGEELIWPSKEAIPLLHQRFADAWHAADIVPSVVMQTTTVESVFNAVEAGIGVGFVRGSVVVPRQGLVLKAVVDLRLTMHLSMVWRRDAEMPALRRLVGEITRVQPVGP